MVGGFGSEKVGFQSLPHIRLQKVLDCGRTVLLRQVRYIWLAVAKSGGTCTRHCTPRCSQRCHNVNQKDGTRHPAPWTHPLHSYMLLKFDVPRPGAWTEIWSQLVNFLSEEVGTAICVMVLPLFHGRQKFGSIESLTRRSGRTSTLSHPR